MALDPGTTLGPYTVTAKIGEGGMGEVYRARDTKLDRDVALKVLSDAFTSDPDRLARFEREAKLLASLNHPNIGHIYGLQEAEAEGGTSHLRALVLELVEGPTLADLIGRGPIPIEDTLPIVRQIAEALEAAHGQGIIHRDLKPANVKVRDDGTVKLLDFGLARPVAEDDMQTVADMTIPGRVFGTPGYMAPEQLSATDVDARADLFATGVVLYEMVTGQRPFGGATPMAAFHAVMYERPPALTGSGSIEAVDRIIHRALEKKPADRYQTARAVAEDIQAVTGRSDSGVSPQPRAVTRLVVLPFRVLPPDPETDFLAVGLADAITGSLSGLESLVVRSSLAASPLSGTALDLKAIATALDVDAVLAGTLMRAGDQLRVSAQLLEAPAGTVMWSGKSQSRLGDLFALQDEFSQRIVESLSIPLSRREEQLLKRDVPATARAYEYYLRGNQHANGHNTAELARDMYAQCLVEDPLYAPAWARIGRMHRILANLGDRAAAAESHRKAEEAFTRALEINPDLSLAQNLYAYLEVDLGRAREAMVRLLARAHQQRADPELFAGLVHACRYCGLLEASVAAYENAKRFDPHIRTSVCHTFLMLEDYRRAIETEHSDGAGFMQVLSALRQGQGEEMIPRLRELEQMAPGAMQEAVRAVIAAIERRAEDFVVAFERSMQGIRDPEFLYQWSLMASHVGDTTRALDTLERVVDGGWCCAANMARDPWLDHVRDEPQFIALLRKAEERHRAAADAFREAGGDRLLGVTTAS